MRWVGAKLAVAVVWLTSAANAADYLHLNGHDRHWASDLLAFLERDKPTPDSVSIEMTSEFDIHVYAVRGTFTGVYSLQHFRHAPASANPAVKAIVDGGIGKIIGFVRLPPELQHKQSEQVEQSQAEQTPQRDVTQQAQPQQPTDPQSAQQAQAQQLLPAQSKGQEQHAEQPQEPQQQQGRQEQQSQEAPQPQQQAQPDQQQQQVQQPTETSAPRQQPQEPAQQQAQSPNSAPAQPDAKPPAGVTGEQSTVYMLTWTKPAS